jgi:ABC-2 type transport system ATP-binding protein
LLAKPDAVRITVPPLPKETMQRVLELIRRDVADDNVRIDTPTQNLESYFLDVVQRARQDAAETSGATSGNRVAAYLRGDAEAEPVSARVLDRLTAPAAKPAVVEPSPAPEPAVDQAKLTELTRPAALAPAPEPQQQKESAAAPSKEEISKANEKLASLLGQPK